jgi:hypothetical protein
MLQAVFGGGPEELQTGHLLTCYDRLSKGNIPSFPARVRLSPPEFPPEFVPARVSRVFVTFEEVYLTEPPASWATLLSGIAAILNSVAWPGVALWFLSTHRVRIAFLLKVFGRKLSQAKKVKVWQLELDELEEEVKEAVVQAGAGVIDDFSSKSVPTSQVEAAEHLEAKVRMAGIPGSKIRETVRREIYELAREYEITRASESSSALRTRKMNEIAAGMRTLAIAGKGLRTELTRSESVGRRLAAICMLQVEPRPRYLSWLIERVKTESQPFVFYQAALAVLETVRKKRYINPDEARSQITAALDVISRFQGGQPDQNTIDALNEALLLLT